jgi:hypothetical protein
MTEKKKPKRYSISVSGTTYARLRTSVASASLQKFVDGILVSALDDPTIRERLLAKCLAGDTP